MAVLLEEVMLQRMTRPKYPVGYQLLSKNMDIVFVIYEMSKTTFATTEITAQKLCSVTHNYKVQNNMDTGVYDVFAVAHKGANKCDELCLVIVLPTYM